MLLELNGIRMSYTGGHRAICCRRSAAAAPSPEEGTTLIDKNDSEASVVGSPKRRDLLDGVDLSIPEGEVTALIGGNGAGKTTLFNIISGFEKNYSGTVCFNGRKITRLSPHHISRLGIGRLFQGRQLMENLTLKENLLLATGASFYESPFAAFLPHILIRRSEEKKTERAKEILVRLFGPDNVYLDKLDTKSSELSYGQQRLMALVRLLMGNYRLLLLDEPTSGISPSLFGAFREIIREMVDKEGKTIVLIEHNMGFVREVADNCNYLAEGKIILKGKASEVLDDPVIRKDYMGL